MNAFGFIETPYRKVVDGKVTDQVEYLTADEEDKFAIAQAELEKDADGTIIGERIEVRLKDGDIGLPTLPASITLTFPRARWFPWQPP